MVSFYNFFLTVVMLRDLIVPILKIEKFYLYDFLFYFELNTHKNCKCINKKNFNNNNTSSVIRFDKF